MQIFGRRFDTAQPVQVDVADGTITHISPEPVDEVQASRWPWLSPGWTDIQTNGYAGQEFSSKALTPEKVAEIAGAYLACGVTRFCPTLTTESFEVLAHGLGTIDAACKTRPELARRIVGIHLEGPYLSLEDGARGAHPLAHCRPPNWGEFQRLQAAAGGRIRIHTMSPEYDESVEFIRNVVASGVIVSIGHTAASPQQIRAAVDAGARLSTHLGNGAHLFLRRHPNYIWSQLAEDRLWAGMIADGHHLPPEVVKSFVRAKTARQTILVSDMSGLAGLPPGRYQTGLCELEILDDGRLVVAGQRDILAGASLPLGVGVANVTHFAGVDLGTAIRMVTHNPAELLGVRPDRLERYSPANLVQFDLAEPHHGKPPKLELRATVADGRLAWGTPWQP